MRSIRNDKTQFGLLSIVLHWLIAVLVLCVFILGFWMVDLDYYDAWYQRAPWWHKGLGGMVTLLVLLRWCWQYYSASPQPLASIPRWQQYIAQGVHLIMNIIILLLAVTGYLIVTAKGQELNLFDLVKIPAIINSNTNLEDVAGKLHQLMAWLLIALVALHSLAALKHHFIDKDMTLNRILGRHRSKL